MHAFHIRVIYCCNHRLNRHIYTGFTVAKSPLFILKVWNRLFLFKKDVLTLAAVSCFTLHNASLVGEHAGPPFALLWPFNTNTLAI